MHVTSKGSSWVQASSDRRDKTKIEPINSAINFINKLEPVTYNFNFREDYYDADGNFDEESYKNATKSNDRRISGFIAQDVYSSMISEYNNDNYANIIDYNKYPGHGEDEKLDKYRLRETALIPFLTRAIQEQQEEIELLKKEIELLKKDRD